MNRGAVSPINRKFWGCQDGAAVMAWQPRSRRSYGIAGKVWQPHDTEPVIRAGPSQVDSGAGQTWPFAHVSDPRHNVSTSISTTDTPLPLGRRRSVAMPREPERSGRHVRCPPMPKACSEAKPSQARIPQWRGESAVLVYRVVPRDVCRWPNVWCRRNVPMAVVCVCVGRNGRRRPGTPVK